MTPTTLQSTTTYSIFTCTTAGCGLSFALDDAFVKARREDHATFYCPNGHGRWFPQRNETEALRAELDQMQANRDQYRDWYRTEMTISDGLKRRVAAQKGVITRMKNRIANGVCPVPGCKRSGFRDVHLHIATKHPDFQLPEGV